MEADHRRAVFLHHGKGCHIKGLAARVSGNVGRCQAEFGEMRCEQVKPGFALRLIHGRRPMREEIEVIRRIADGSADGGERRIKLFRAVHRAGE